jgi:hypothetical protein
MADHTDLAAQHSVFVAQHQQLHILARPPAKDHDKRTQQPTHHHVDDRQQHQAIISTPRPGRRNSTGQRRNLIFRAPQDGADPAVVPAGHWLQDNTSTALASFAG